MPTTAPGGTGGGTGGSWYVYAIAYPNDPSNAQPLVTQTQETGTTALAGPFNTQTEAQAWVDAHPEEFGKGKTNIAPPSDTPVTGGTPGLPSNPLTSLAAIGHWLGVAVAALTDKYTWISVGWLLLGLILVIIAVLILAKRTDLLPSAVPVPVPV